MEQMERALTTAFNSACEHSQYLQKKRAYLVGEERVAAEASAAHKTIIQTLEVNADTARHQTLLDVQIRAKQFETIIRDECETRAQCHSI